MACNWTYKIWRKSMLKRTIYSIMALSLTLMPMSEVFAEELPYTSYPVTGNVHLYSSGTAPAGEDYYHQINLQSATETSPAKEWTAGTITNTGGVLSITGYKPYVPTGATTPPNYVQDNANSYLALFDDGQLEMIGSQTGGLAVISAGHVNLYGVYSPTTGTGRSVLTIGTGAGISEAAIVEIKKDNMIVLNGNTSTTASPNPSLVLNSGDKWDGIINTKTASGYLKISGNFEKGNDAIYTQSSGKIVIDDSSTTFDLNNSGDEITGGVVNIGSTTTGNVLTVSAGKIYGSAASSQDPYVVINEGSALQIKGTGDVTLNYGDDWEGAINVSGGTLTLSNRLDDGVEDYTDVTNSVKTYNQTGGVMNLGNTEGGAELTLADANSKFTGGTINIANDDSSFILDNNSTNFGNINMSKGSFTVSGSNYVTNTLDSENKSRYTQTGGNLYLTNGANMNLTGTQATPSQITGGTVNIGTSGATDKNNRLYVEAGGKIESGASVDLRSGNYIHLTGNAGGNPSLVLDNSNPATADSWAGTITNSGGSGYLKLEGFNNYGLDDSATAIYQQESGNLRLSDAVDGAGKHYYSKLFIGTPESFISGGAVNIESGNNLVILEDTNVEGKYDTISSDVAVFIEPESFLAVAGNGTVILNDNLLDLGSSDEWDGNVVVGAGVGDIPTLTLKNVTKDFTNSAETGSLSLNSGNLNVYANSRGGSHLTIYGDKKTDNFNYAGGQINVKGYDKNNLSTVTEKMTKNGTLKQPIPVNMKGNAELVYEMNKHNVTFKDVAPTGTGPNNTMVEKGKGNLTIDTPKKDLKMGYNVRVEDGSMTVNAKSMKIGTTYTNEDGKKVNYGDLQVGMPKNKAETHFYTSALKNKILGSMNLNNAWYHTTNPASTTSIGKNFKAGSGVDMMYGKINSINVKGTTTVDNLKLKIDVDPATYRADTINSSRVVANKNSKLDLVDYNLLSTPTRDKYTFRVVNATNENYDIASSAQKVVSQKKITWTDMGGYTMIPSSVKGAFDMVLLFHNPKVFTGQVAPNIIYANQQVINNQLFDRMIFSNLPYFNGICSNKTAAADTLYSPYQYSTSDTGLWFKPYANFEKIHMSYVGNVKNSAYGAMIGADFARKQWGAWSFIPSAFVGYNGGYSKYNGYGLYGGSSLLHNGGQAGFMGTFTAKDFVTSFALYAGGYHNHMNYPSKSANNALWNAGVASKTAYNIHLPWHFILQPTLYMAYNYIGGSSYNSFYEGYRTKIDPYNAFSIAPGVSLIWQRETFSIYGLFQAMFNIGSSAGGQIAELDLPHVGIRDPYFEYGLGASKFFGERYSGYGQVVARSGSRKGVGFQLGLNMKL